jgi:hypothetical protein
LPLFSKVLLDDRGGIWLSDYVGFPTSEFVRPTRWTSIDGGGAPTATLVLPKGFVLSEITGRVALGVLEREDGSRALEAREVVQGE